MDVAAKIEAEFGSRLIGWQFAADGAWDQAEKIFFDETGGANVGAVASWLLRQTSPNIAFEGLFDLACGGRIFFGVRLTPLAVAAKLRVFENLLNLCGKGENLVAVVSKIRNVLATAQLASGRPDYLELGVFDFWNRVKSLVVWPLDYRSGPVQAFLPVAEIAARAPVPEPGFAALHLPQPKPLMLEAAWKLDAARGNLYQCWVSLPVSAPDATGLSVYQIVPERYVAVVWLLAGIKALASA